MRNRTRTYKSKFPSINIFGFICVIMSIIIVIGILLPTQSSDNSENEEKIEAYVTQSAKSDTEKNNSDSVTASNVFWSGYSDISNAENEAKKLLESITNEGDIYSEDYSSKNATSSVGTIYIRNTTKDHTDIKFESYLNKNVFAQVNKQAPAVLVYHTHASESYQIIENDFYSDFLVGDSETLGVVRAGDALCKKLESYGYEVIHDRTIYDVSNSGAFERSREKISEILRANPSVQIVIDLHRDSISRKDGSKVKTVTEINGKKTAQIQITTGCEDGAVTGFPNWEKNLTFALHLQKILSDSYPHIARPLLFCSRKYNMDLVPCAVNIDIGTESNTIREAVYSAEILGDAVAKILKECEN